MDHATLTRAVEQDAALRRRQTLQPVGGKNDKLFPPTYPEERRRQGPRHVFERRRLNGREAWCVLLDSEQSQANRLEEALLAAVRDKAIALPYVNGREIALSRRTRGLRDRTPACAPLQIRGLLARHQELSVRARLRGGGRSRDRTSLRHQIR